MERAQDTVENASRFTAAQPLSRDRSCASSRSPPASVGRLTRRTAVERNLQPTQMALSSTVRWPLAWGALMCCWLRIQADSVNGSVCTPIATLAVSGGPLVLRGSGANISRVSARAWLMIGSTAVSAMISAGYFR